MAAVSSGEQATEIAVSFLKKGGWSFARPVSAQRKNDVWLVEVDVGAIGYQVGALKISAKTGAILEYKIPQSILKALAQ